MPTVGTVGMGALKLTLIVERKNGPPVTIVLVEDEEHGIPLSVDLNWSRDAEPDLAEMARQGSAFWIYKPGKVVSISVNAAGAPAEPE